MAPRDSQIPRSPNPPIHKSVGSLSLYRRWSHLLDSRFRIPGTNIRFGLDPILSLIPGFGDLASPLFTALLILQGLRQRVPKVVLIRMVMNAILDALIGAVPVAGNIGDIFWRANSANLALLERHARPGQPPARSDYIFAFGLLAALAALVVIPFVLALWLMTQFLAWFTPSLQ